MAHPSDPTPSRTSPSYPSFTGEQPAYQAYRSLHIGFTVLPIVMGVDKFFNLLGNWEAYLAPVILGYAHLAAHTFMMVVGVIEVIAGLLVAFRPRIGAYIVMLWLCGIIVNLLLIPGHYDIAVRDFGLLIGAFALARLSRDFGPYPKL
jgi:hypothetical protein